MHQDASNTMGMNSENNIPNSPKAALRFMICVRTRTSIALTITNTEVPVNQQSFPLFFDMVYEKSTYNSSKL